MTTQRTIERPELLRAIVKMTPSMIEAYLSGFDDGRDGVPEPEAVRYLSAPDADAYRRGRRDFQDGGVRAFFSPYAPTVVWVECDRETSLGRPWSSVPIDPASIAAYVDGPFDLADVDYRGWLLFWSPTDPLCIVKVPPVWAIVAREELQARLRVDSCGGYGSMTLVASVYGCESRSASWECRELGCKGRVATDRRYLEDVVCPVCRKSQVRGAELDGTLAPFGRPFRRIIDEVGSVRRPRRANRC